MDLHPNAQRVMRGFQAFAEGDMATMKELLAEDTTWHSTGRNAFAEDYHGVDAILRNFGELTAIVQIDNTPHAILADDEHVVVLTDTHYTRGDTELDGSGGVVFHVDGGVVTEAWVTSLDPYAFDDLVS